MNQELIDIMDEFFDTTQYQGEIGDWNVINETYEDPDDEAGEEFATTTIIRRYGGPGSGHHGHAGRPGMVGGSGSGGIETAPNGIKGIDEYRNEAKDRIREWQKDGMSVEEILYDGYRWKRFAYRSNDGWDWAMYEEIQKLARDNNFHYKANLSVKDIFNTPKISTDLFVLMKTRFERIESKVDTATTNYRNYNNKREMQQFLNSKEGKLFSILSQRELWGNVVYNAGRKTLPSSVGGLRKIGEYEPYPGSQLLIKAKTFSEARNTKITVYRGIVEGVKERRGLTSYTTAPKIAKAFAEGYYFSSHKKGTGVVIAKTVKLKDIKGQINIDGEHEVLLEIK